VELDAAVNKGGPGRISTQHSRVEVHVITTDEEAMIAQHTNDML
jgi:acetate kinase